MKQCPVCNQVYTDEDLNFCLNDGELLRIGGNRPAPASVVDDSPPTVMLNDARVTNPSAWQAPPAIWQGPNQPVPQQFGGQFPMMASPDQTLAVVALCLGIASMTIGWCCSSGMLLAPAALITGLIALSQIKKNPERYGGRPLAIGGVVGGSVYLALIVLFLILYGSLFFFSLFGR